MPGRRTTLIVALLLLELVLAGPARADAGTPLMWAGLAHLVAGNAIIGIGEGLLLAWLFALEPFRSVPIMVLANYVSMIAGPVILSAALEAPFVRWISRNATVLPDGQVVYQLGDQIVLLDLRSRRIRLAARGHGPVVVLTRSTRSAPVQQAI